MISSEMLDIIRWKDNLEYPKWCIFWWMKKRYFIHELKKQRVIFRKKYGYEL